MNNIRICPEKRFYSKVLIPNGNGCMLWIGRKNKAGYGSFSVGKKIVSVHRFSYKLHNGDIEKGKFVLHKCDNPSCVAPDHLFLGTQLENMRDMQSKGRKKDNSAFLKKVNHHARAKLSMENVIKIKELLKNGFKSKLIANMFLVSKSAIEHIKTNYTWRNV